MMVDLIMREQIGTLHFVKWTRPDLKGEFSQENET
jgi:hypothetical protein